MASFAPSPLPVEAPRLRYIAGEEQHEFQLSPAGFTIGRRSGKGLVILDPRISRDHAEIVPSGDGYLLRDLGSRHGTWVNGARVETAQLKPGDEIALGASDGPRLIFAPLTGMARDFLRQLSMVTGEEDSGAADLQKLSLFLELARKLDSPSALEDVLVSLIETTLRLTGAERGYVFLQEAGELRLAAARNRAGEPIAGDQSISRSTIHDALASATDFIFSDTAANSGALARQSIVDQNLRMVLCIPLRPRLVREEVMQSLIARPEAALGALYLDSHAAARGFSSLNADLLHAIANQAANLVENARLARAEREARRIRQELSIAAEIQRRLLPLEWPALPEIELRGSSLPCQQVGGDFFDCLAAGSTVYAALIDVAGKGISAALLAASLQGMIYAQLLAGVPLATLAAAVNTYLCQRLSGEKYATGILASLDAQGRLEYVNCGHVPPLLARGGAVERLREGGMPLGLFAGAEYASTARQLLPGDRLLLVTDGVTEVENDCHEFFGEERLEAALAAGGSIASLQAAVDTFRGPVAMLDDCTLLEFHFRGPATAAR